jgi:sideroflexin-1/3
MSAQVPCSLVITAGMLTFYRTKLGIISWQWMMQSYNAAVNYTNRSGDKPIPMERIGLSFLIATSTATSTALYLNSLAKKRAASPLVGRLVPFAAVLVANCINIPFMRSSELQHGIQLYDEDNNKIGLSQYAASLAVAKVIFSRSCLRAISMVIPPVLMVSLEKRIPIIRTNRFVNFGIQLAFIGTSLVIATPLTCAIFPQKYKLNVEQLEYSVQRELAEKGYSPTDVVIYNKGL